MKVNDIVAVSTMNGTKFGRVVTKDKKRATINVGGNIITAEIWAVMFFFNKANDCIYASRPTSCWGYQLLTALSGVWLLLTLVLPPLLIMHYLDKK